MIKWYTPHSPMILHNKATIQAIDLSSIQTSRAQGEINIQIPHCPK